MTTAWMQMGNVPCTYSKRPAALIPCPLLVPDRETGDTWKQHLNQECTVVPETGYRLTRVAECPGIANQQITRVSPENLKAYQANPFDRNPGSLTY